MSYGFDIRLLDGVTGPARSMANAMDKAKRSGHALKGQVESINPPVKKIGMSFANLRNLLGVGFAVEGLRSLGGSVIDTMGKFETMESVLTNTLGSNSAAKQLFADIKQFAATTPFQIDELSEAAVKLANRGILPTMTEMRNMGDLAATLGKPFGDLNEAMLDVSNTERWTELGIKVRKEGDRMIGTFRGVSVEVAATESGALEMVKSFGQMDGVRGSMEGISKTTAGMLSNLKDTGVNLAFVIGDALRGVIQGAIKMASGIATTIGNTVTWMRENAAVLGVIFEPLRQAFKPIADAFKQLIKDMGLTNSTGTIMEGVFNAIGNVIRFISPALMAFGKMWAQIIGYFRQLIVSSVEFYKSSSLLQGIVKGLGSVIITVFTRVGTFVANLFGGIKDVIAGVFSMDSAQIGQGLKGISKAFTADAAGFAKDIKANYDAMGKPVDFFNRTQSVVDTDHRDPESIREGKPKSLFGGGSGLAPGGGSGGKELSQVRGDSVQGGIKHITINIQKLVEQLNIQTTNLGMSEAKIKAEMSRILLSVVNDVNYG